MGYRHNSHDLFGYCHLESKRIETGVNSRLCVNQLVLYAKKRMTATTTQNKSYNTH